MVIENNLGKDNVRQLVWRIAIPSMLAQFVSVLYSIVDRMYIGNIPEVGDLALAGVGVCGPVVTMVGSAAFLVGIGGSPLMSIRMGEGRMDEAKRILANCFLMICALAAVLFAVVVPLRRPMLMLFGASEATYPYADAYFTAYMCGTLFALIANGMNQFIICQGYAKVGMKSVMLGAALNIVLDPVFIFLFDMGVTGGAVATVISQAASALYVLRFLFSSLVPVRISFGGYSLVTCATIAQSFMLVVTMPLGGISGGTQTILSYNYGARQTSRVRSAQKYITGLCVGYTVLLFAAARVCGGLFVRLFTQDPAVAQQALWAIRVCTLAIIPLGVQYELVDGFTALGQVKLSLPLSFWRKGVYFVSLFLLPALFGAEAIFYAEPISDVLGPVVTFLVWLVAMPRILRRREQQAEKPLQE